MAALEARPAPAAATDAFKRGKYTAKPITTCNAPKTLFIVTPDTEGTYPVLLFLHGYNICPCCYTNLLEHISSHGYIVVAPRLLSLCSLYGRPDINSAAEVANWLSSGLQPVLPENVVPDLSRLALAGHSRGGYLAFALALGNANVSMNLKFLTLIGIDPVAGANKCMKMCPKILTGVPHSFNLDIPVMVIGTGLGGESVIGCIPCSCAPDGLNYAEFFNECKDNCLGFVIPDYGHMDMLDDDYCTNCIGTSIGAIMGSMCKSGKGDKTSMMECVGGIVVAMLMAHLEGETGDLDAIVDEPGIAPVKLEVVEDSEP
ncbi:hypothetical protein VitviT2T_009271 [Vitis vinifera]|uniref:Chlorophyllase n=2 Tax=Vitis vinifera TaxID=29760 RepID=A0ABY9C4V2_VITVI|nr:chlorophyllase-1 [Vitis vinifera]WJZ90100.1 hypothetical protein VitviT2T_009271 [Vitis vinifera]|eukprot:XP_002271936.2 PREDICTED: chlorophyllase-1 [Vitis vinifera]